MKREEHAALDSVADEASEKAEEWLRSDTLAELRAALVTATASLPKEYQVSLDVTLNVFDEKREKTIELLEFGLCVAKDMEPYEASGTSTSHRYIVNGELCEVPHEHCPHCWSTWVMKLEQPVCSSCGYEMGKQVKLLLDNDLCPFCEEGELTLANPKCKLCGYAVDPAFIAWG